MYDDILLPTDGSSETVDAIDHALTVASDETTIHVLYVVDRRHVMAADDDTKDEVRRSLEEEGDHALDDARVRIEDGGVGVTTVRQEGIPHRTIVDYATEEDIDLVVMGTHGETGPQKAAAMGSTTERVVGDISVPVLVVNI